MTNVRPIRRAPTLVDVGQTVEEAEWQAGWDAAMDQQHESEADGYARGFRNGLRAGMECGPTWTNMVVCSTATFIAGFCIAIGYFGG